VSETSPWLRSDVLGEPYVCEDIPLSPDDEGDVVATLIHREPLDPSRRAVLHVHGFADYFFHTDYADYWVEQGYDFYAMDLRKYGRSLRPHQTPNFTDDLCSYFDELDEAYHRITGRDGHREVVISAHSTGGLIAALWLEASRPDVTAVVLNAPFLELQGPLMLRTGIGLAADQIGARRPKRELPRTVSGLYGRSLHKDYGGEWDFDVAWKPIESWPIYVGWLRAIRRGQQDVHRGLTIPAPILVLTSAESSHPRAWTPDVDRTDIVLNVEDLRKWAGRLGPHVTSIAIDDALHDVILSRPDVRARAKQEITRWLAAYAPVKKPAARPRRSTRSA
jgi:alpha-beta hydrolase superfamily lysophospholipase